MKSRRKSFKATALKPRSSLTLCQEKYACKESEVVSVFCRECDTYQCDACEVLLHEDERLLFHLRKHVLPPSQEILCDGNCPEKNYADVICSVCNSKFCYRCDRVVHSEKSKKTHPRGRFLQESEEFLSCEAYISEREESSEEEEMMSLEDSICLDQPHVHQTTEPESKLATITSFLLINENEKLQLKSEDEFVQKLGCEEDMPFKVLSIFGNTGDGKSYTLNHTFFSGEEVFKTSTLQTSCTVGAWAAFCPTSGIIAIDTEGFLGQSNNPNTRARMLLKILAISDIIVYRTRAERLHDDMFTFLGHASEAYFNHFSQELKEASSRCNIDGPVSLLGPAVIIFHETKHTEPYTRDAEKILRNQFHKMGLHIDAFCSLEYVGVQSLETPTNFEPFGKAIEQQLKLSNIRIARSPKVIFQMLKILTDKFSMVLDKNMPKTFPDQYFTCPISCISCKSRCSKSMNHSKDDIPHFCATTCIYQHQFENKRSYCKKCYERGEHIVVEAKNCESKDSYLAGLAKYAWQGYVLECRKCGIIYRSRQYWYGNTEPDGSCTHSEICHMWSDSQDEFNVSSNTGQVVIDNIGTMAGAVSSVSATSTKYLADWLANKTSPSYWTPNSEVTHCGPCKVEFGDLVSKHHCRICGGIFCNPCSSKKLLVKGWGSSMVRVCSACYEANKSIDQAEVATQSEKFTLEVNTRIVTEFVQKTLATAVGYPAGLIKNTARPTYWIPDSELVECKVCLAKFSERVPIHHCRACGGGVCEKCSLHRKPVPLRGWKYDVRVCNLCVNES